MGKRELLEAKLSLSEGELMTELGAELSRTEGFDLSKIPSAELWNKAEQWMALNRAKIVRQLCHDWKLAEKANQSLYTDPLFLATQIADIVAALHSHVPPYTVGALLAKIGITELCRGTA